MIKASLTVFILLHGASFNPMISMNVQKIKDKQEIKCANDDYNCLALTLRSRGGANSTRNTMQDIQTGPGINNDVVGRNGYVCKTLFGNC